MKKQTIKINESQLRQIIRESINEISPQTIDNAERKAGDLNHNMWKNNLSLGYGGKLDTDTRIGDVLRFLDYLIKSRPNNRQYIEMYNNFNNVVSQLTNIVSKIGRQSNTMKYEKKERFLKIFLDIAKKIGIYNDVMNSYSMSQHDRFSKKSETDIMIEKVNDYIINQSKYYNRSYWDGEEYEVTPGSNGWDWDSVSRKTGAKLFDLLDANKDKFTPEELQLVEYIKQHRSLPTKYGQLDPY